ncbi:MAG: hypothetical protein VKL59_24765 [Nostocaceae cyanobacterium]|nr:hypothetical protein [Nostocaceae cyanobacterium]
MKQQLEASLESNEHLLSLTKMILAGCDDFSRKSYREANTFIAMHKLIGVRYIYKTSIYNQTPKYESVLILDSRLLSKLATELLNNFPHVILNLNQDYINIFRYKILVINVLITVRRFW